MPFLALLKNPLVRKLALYGLIAFAIAVSVFAAIKHYEAVGERRAKDEQHNADMVWLKDAQADARTNKALADERAAQNDKLEKSRAAQQITIARASAANDGRGCIDADGSDRLRMLDPGAINGSVQNAARQRGHATAGTVRR